MPGSSFRWALEAFLLCGSRVRQALLARRAELRDSLSHPAACAPPRGHLSIASFIDPAGAGSSLSSGFSIWYGMADIGRRLVLSQPLVDHLAQQAVIRPAEIFDLDNKRGLHPMHAAKNQRRPEAVGARWWHLQRHLGHGKRLEALPQSPKLRIVDAPADTAGIYQSAVWSVVRQQERT